MNTRHIVTAAALLTGVWASGAAQARSPVDVQWQVTIGSPHVGLPGPGVVVLPPPVVVAPQHPVGYRSPARWDRDGDGIPNRYDNRYNPRWDRDGDGIPNRHDTRYTPRWDVDGDGVPNRYDRRPYDPRDARHHGRHHDHRDDHRRHRGRDD